MPRKNLPSTWERGNIRLFAQMKSGHTPSRSVPEYWQNTDVPWFTLADVWQLRDGKQVYLGETASTINHLGLANSSAELLPAETVVLSRTASVGFSGIMPTPMATSQDFWNWVCGPRLLPEYLNYQFKSMQGVFKSLIMGSTHQTIYQKDAASLQIVVPPPDEQRAIVDFLDRETARIDTLIEEQQRLIEMLSERRASMLRKAIHEAGHARLDKLGRHTRIGNGSTPRRDNLTYWSDDGFPWLNSAVVNAETVTSTEQFVAEVALSECHLPVVPPGSVLVGLTGQGKTRGKATMLTIEATVSQHLAYVTPDTDFWDSKFLTWLLRASYDDLRALSDENGSTKGGLTCSDLKSFRVVRPSLEAQRRLASYIDNQTSKVDALISETERFIELSRERRAALLTAAVTGQIDVREVAG